MTASTSAGIFTAEQLACLDSQKIPQHVAIIPDGNRRWAKQRGFLSSLGHETGAQRVMDTMRAAKAIGIRHVTLYSFSTENWRRSKAEVMAIFRIITRFVTDHRDEMLREGMRLSHIGQLEGCPRSTQRAVQESEEATRNCSDIDLVLALNYGGRDEICRVAQQLAREAQAGQIQPEQIDENLFASRLDSAAWGDPELLIRTSGELRISNFLIWQLSYGEIITLDALWPDFTPDALLDTIAEYQKRIRREGS